MMSLWNLTSPRQNNRSGSKRNDETPLIFQKTKSYIHTWVMDNGENTHRNYILNI